MGFGHSSQSSNSSSQQASESKNQAYPFLQGALGGEVANAGAGTNAIKALLGLSGDTGQKDAFNTFRDSSGYNFLQDEGVRGITSSNAAKGLLGSGSALKSITNFSSNLANSFLDKYLNHLTGVSSQGLQAAQILSGAGNTANSQGTSISTSKGSSTNASLG
jgi:hypothetical protein